MANKNFDLGAYHLADNPDLYEVQRSNNFEFVVTGLDKLLKSSVDADTANDKDYITNGQEVLRMSVSKTSIPNFKQEPIEIRRGNSRIKLAGVPTFDAGTLVVNDFIGADTKSVLMAWQRLSYDVTTEKVGRAKDYKKTCSLVEYTPDYEKVREWTLEGCWISSLREEDFDNENSNKKLITATFEYDRAKVEVE